MRIVTLALPVIFGLSACMSTAPHGRFVVRKDHPYLGRWTWTYRGCVEVYENRPDGTSAVTSGAEVGESKYTITAYAEQNGFYRLVDIVTNSNGKTGCDGSPGGTPIGDEAVSFVLIRSSGEEMIFCKTPALDKCMGPLRRLNP